MAGACDEESWLLRLPEELLYAILSEMDATNICRSAGVKSLRSAAESCARRTMQTKFPGLQPRALSFRCALWYAERRTGSCQACGGNAAAQGCRRCMGTGCASDVVRMTGHGAMFGFGNVADPACGWPQQFVRQPNGSFMNGPKTALIRRSRVPDDENGWWVTSSMGATRPNDVNVSEPGVHYYYCNRSHGDAVPVIGWEYHQVLRNGLGWTRGSHGRAPAPTLTYMYDVGGPPLPFSVGPEPPPQTLS